MRVAIEKECAQIPVEILLDVLGPFIQNIKSVLKRTVKNLSLYFNSSFCEQSEIVPRVFVFLLDPGSDFPVLPMSMKS